MLQHSVRSKVKSFFSPDFRLAIVSVIFIDKIKDNPVFEFFLSFSELVRVLLPCLNYIIIY
jgi:hypothetical protein